MVFYITCLRALAACLITNSHYTGIYPTDLIANGGLIGGIIFFAVSGYCLYNIKGSFPKWYGKRLIRCYLPVLLITALYMVLGAYSLGEQSALWWYIYPTYYHFVASIVVLYIPYFVVIKINVLRDHISSVMMLIAIVYFIIYILFYDTSYYHIDTVREPMIRFLFMESMLLGAYFKQNDRKFRNHFSWWMPVAVVVSLGAYFASKLIFSRKENWSDYQIINQMVIFVLLFVVFRLFAGLDGKFEKLPKTIRICIAYQAKITLEIYVVQYVLIDWIRPMFVFPLNWIVLTVVIIVAATVLHIVSQGILRLLTTVIERVKKFRPQN